MGRQTDEAILIGGQPRCKRAPPPPKQEECIFESEAELRKRRKGHGRLMFARAIAFSP
jgi:hypothetical protein